MFLIPNYIKIQSPIFNVDAKFPNVEVCVRESRTKIEPRRTVGDNWRLTTSAPEDPAHKGRGSTGNIWWIDQDFSAEERDCSTPTV
ncbi:hypothetical protein K0M31_008395 [Melipona bicolor]|uniref:Uncharacterized protein n=1 Tax=Melipona bicolor TaxID=60889 RepID=A0AA40KKH5_9HYME|nr:hypothetical protein K0M31_008395 [Melipona bicolor]